jgi:hypothetical protein
MTPRFALGLLVIVATGCKGASEGSPDAGGATIASLNAAFCAQSPPSSFGPVGCSCNETQPSGNGTCVDYGPQTMSSFCVLLFDAGTMECAGGGTPSTSPCPTNYLAGTCFNQDLAVRYYGEFSALGTMNLETDCVGQGGCFVASGPDAG